MKQDCGKKAVEPQRHLHGHTDDIVCVALLPPSTLATSSNDGTIMLWNIESGIRHPSIITVERYAKAVRCRLSVLPT